MKEATAKELTHKMRLDVLLEASHRCSNPRCFEVIILEAHHIWWVKDGGPNELSNLIALCANCHGKVTNGLFSEEQVRMWKGMLMALNHSVGRQGMDVLLFLKDMPPPFHVSNDAVLSLSGLVVSGLVQLSTKFTTVESPNSSSTLICGSGTRILQLTERGEALVDAWLKGDEAAYLRMVKGTSSESE